jgi:hypothetical protein
VLKHAPPLSPRAIQTLKNGRMDSETRIWIDGPAYFRELYGDFFVSGFVLGADAGASVSADTRASTVEEASELTVKVKFLFLEAERKEKSTSQVSSLSASMNFCGYSTLEKKTVAAGKDSSQASEQQIRELASSFMPKIHGLQKEVGERVIDLGLTDGGTIALTAATRICHSNLVVQLILSPFARLEEYVHHASRSISTDF